MSEGWNIPIKVSRKQSGAKLAVPPGHPLASQGGRTVRLRLGKRSITARTVLLPNDESIATLEVGSGTPWPRGKPVQLWLRRASNGTWRVGPIVGILSKVYRKSRYGPQNTLFQRMIKEAESLGSLAFIFSTGSVDYARGRVRGYQHSGRAWRASYFPLPDVMYNRSQTTPAIRRLEVRLRRRYRVRVFNSRLGSKWRQYRILSRDPELRPYLPVTRVLRSGQDLRSIVARFGGVYVKPIRGGFGKGIWRVERRGRGYDVRRTDARGRSRRLGVISLAQAYRAMRRTGSMFIVQQRLHLIRSRGSIADVRVLTQKDAFGQWGVTGAGVRIGQGRTIVSNLAGGGRAQSLSDVLQEVFPDRPDLVAKIQELTPTVALRIAKRLERFSAPLGELGIDLGIDRSGQVWFLEANSRTGRSLFHRIDHNESGRQADRRPMEYALHLAGFQPEPSSPLGHKLSYEEQRLLHAPES